MSENQLQILMMMTVFLVAFIYILISSYHHQLHVWAKRERDNFEGVARDE